MIDNNEIDRVMSKTQVLSQWQDIDMAATILEFMQPLYVLELGAGAGGWITSMNSLLPGNNITWVGYENFQWDYGQGWPKTPYALKILMQQQARSLGSTLNNIVIKDENVRDINLEFIESLNFKFDVVRLDCLHKNMEEVIELFNKILPFTSDRCIFFVDDIVPHIAINRLLGVMELVKQGTLKPIWLGLKEGGFCKSDLQITDLLNHVNQYQNKKLYEFELQEIKFFNSQRNYIRTV